MIPEKISILIGSNPTLKDLFVGLYDLSALDLAVLMFLLKSRNPVDVAIVARKVERDRSTVLRSLQKMVALGICSRDVRNLAEGGYYHVYTASEIKTMKKEVNRKMHEIHASLNRLQRRFDKDIGSFTSLPN